MLDFEFNAENATVMPHQALTYRSITVSKGPDTRALGLLPRPP